jgi:hypothetical protein
MNNAEPVPDGKKSGAKRGAIIVEPQMSFEISSALACAGEEGNDSVLVYRRKHDEYYADDLQQHAQETLIVWLQER